MGRGVEAAQGDGGREDERARLVPWSMGALALLSVVRAAKWSMGTVGPQLLQPSHLSPLKRSGGLLSPGVCPRVSACWHGVLAVSPGVALGLAWSTWRRSPPWVGP